VQIRDTRSGPNYQYWAVNIMDFAGKFTRWWPILRLYLVPCLAGPRPRWPTTHYCTGYFLVAPEDPLFRASPQQLNQQPGAGSQRARDMLKRVSYRIAQAELSIFSMARVWLTLPPFSRCRTTTKIALPAVPLATLFAAMDAHGHSTLNAWA
jgi:hypothetical protein